MRGPTCAQMDVAISTLDRLWVEFYHVADRTRDLIAIFELVVARGDGVKRLEDTVARWVCSFDVKRSQAVQDLGNFVRLSSGLLVSHREVASEELLDSREY